MSSYNTIPESTIQTIKGYLEHGFEPGHFVRAVLENNLRDAFACADIYNTYAMKAIVMYLVNKVPHNAWGSKEAVNKYLEEIRSKGKTEP